MYSIPYLLKLLTKHRVTGRNKVPWWNRELKTLRKQANRAYHEAFTSKSDQDWQVHRTARTAFKVSRMLGGIFVPGQKAPQKLPGCIKFLASLIPVVSACCNYRVDNGPPALRKPMNICHVFTSQGVKLLGMLTSMTLNDLEPPK